MNTSAYLNKSARLVPIREIARTELAGLVRSIDKDAQYPEEILKALGQAGSFHIGPTAPTEETSLSWNIECMATISEQCLSTAFCMWCQNALRWYLFTSENRQLEETLGSQIATGDLLGGTALSNPMKHLAGIEAIKFHARRTQGGYIVNGTVPWVSNLGPGHYFAAVFASEENEAHKAMAIISCDQDGVVLNEHNKFIALNGTRTYSIHLKEVFVPDHQVIAEPAKPYIERIRSGFILLQTGVAIGLIRNTIQTMLKSRDSHGHVNKFLTMQPESVTEELHTLEQCVHRLAKTPFETTPAYFSEVLTVRLGLADLAVASANAALLHEGARGYLQSSHADRRLREALFMAILTPATKHLRKLLADLQSP